MFLCISRYSHLLILAVVVQDQTAYNPSKLTQQQCCCSATMINIAMALYNFFSGGV